MINAFQSEKKIPVTVIEKTIENRVYQLISHADAPLEHCKEALTDMCMYVDELMRNAEKQKEEGRNDQ